MWRNASARAAGRSYLVSKIRHLQLIRLGEADNDLADVLSIIQKAKRVLELLKGEDSADRRRDDALPHQLQQFLHVLLHQSRIVGNEPTHVHAVEAVIVVEHRQVNRASRLQSRHRDLDVSPTRRQAAHALLDRVSRQSVDHHINAPAVGQRRNLLLEVRLAVVDQMAHAEPGEIIQLRLRTGGDVYLCPVVARQLHSDQPCAAGCGLDQDPLASPHPRLAERIDHCQRDRRQRAGLLERERHRFRKHRACIAGQQRRLSTECGTSQRNDFVPDLYVSYSRTSYDHHTADLDARCKGVVGHVRVKTAHAQQITEV